MAMQVALTTPEESASYLPVVPDNRREAQGPPEWQEWKRAGEAEMGGLIRNGVWDQVKHPDYELVVGAKTIYKQRSARMAKWVNTNVTSSLKDSAKSKDFTTWRLFHLDPRRLASGWCF